MRNSKVAVAAILMMLVMYCGGEANAELGLRSVGGGLSMVSPEQIDGTVGIALNADVGDVATGLSLRPFLSYWSKSFGLFSATTTGLGADLRYTHPINETLNAFGGGGLGLYRSAVDGAWTNYSSASQLNGGIDIHGGVEMNFQSNLSGFAQLVVTRGLPWDSASITLGVTYVLGASQVE